MYLGGVAYVVNDISSWCEILPRHPEDTNICYVKMKKKNIIGGNNIYFTELYEIRPILIKEALLWLKQYNPLYENILLHFDELEDWAKDIEKWRENNV